MGLAATLLGLLLFIGSFVLVVIIILDWNRD